MFDAITFKKLMTYQGHMMLLSVLRGVEGIKSYSQRVWMEVSSAGLFLVREGIDVVPSNPRNSSICGLEIDAGSMVFLPPLDEGDDGTVTVDREEKNKFVILTTMDGNMKLHNWMSPVVGP